jgi:hypothetical protein
LSYALWQSRQRKVSPQLSDQDIALRDQLKETFVRSNEVILRKLTEEKRSQGPVNQPLPVHKLVQKYKNLAF